MPRFITTDILNITTMQLSIRTASIVGILYPHDPDMKSYKLRSLPNHTPKP